MGDNQLTEAQRLHLADLDEIRRQRKAKRDLLSFIQYVRNDYEVNWHHKFICQKLNDFVFGDLNRLMIFAPPRHGKSELVSRMLPAFILGNKPNDSIIATSYSADLATKMNRDVQKIILCPAYKRLFPHVRLGAKGYSQTGDLFELVDHRGYYRAAGVGGGITGMGMNFGIIDDPIKDHQEANSKTFRDRLWDWYTTTFSTRLEKNGKVLITLTRWHNDDLSSRVLDLMKKDDNADKFEVISFPAIRDDYENKDDPRELGDALWENKYSKERHAKTKITVGSRVWQSLYQQNPSPDEGNLIKREWWKWYKQSPARFDQVVMAFDFAVKAKENSDFTVGCVWGRIGANKYLLDQVRARVDFPTACQLVVSFSKKWPQAHKKLVEAKANGPAIVQTLKKMVPGLIEVEPKGDKIARVNAVAPDIEAGNVFLPDPMLAPWIHDYMEEWSAFPLAPHDDVVDASVYALDELRKAGILYLPIAGHGTGTIHG